MSSVSVVATVQASNIPPRVRLDVTDTGSPAINTTVVTRLNPDGSTTPVRTADGLPLQLVASGSNRVGIVYDYEMPLGAPVAYSTQESPANVSAQVVVDSSRVWLVHPGVPSLSVPVGNFRPGTFARRTATVARGVFYPMGRANPIVVTSGVRQGVQSSMTVLAKSGLELAALEALVQDSGTLLLNIPATLGYTMDSGYISVGDIDYTPVTDKLFEQWVDVTMPFVVVDRPAGGSQAQRTLADLLAYPSLSAIQVAYPTLAAVLTGP